ncbi:Hcp family type VI secretion system effector [Pseudomonas sp. NA-150]|uniref:Hcp family type VI secretion system effector n=1 Tax=Pseudomonas sp. NA-150 TaxID=3367525 RepID=UPI0037C975A4
MANNAFMTLTGKSQGLISAGCSTLESISNKYQSDHTDEIMVLSWDHRLFNNWSKTRPTHEPIVVSKYSDKSTPLLAQALSNREEIDGKIDFYRVSPSGTQENFLSISFKGGIIVEQTFSMPHVLLHAGGEHEEQLAIRYREITWRNHIAKTSGYSFWGEEG